MQRGEPWTTPRGNIKSYQSYRKGMLFFFHSTFYFTILFYSMVVVSNSSSGITSAKKLDVAILASSTVNSTMVLILFLLHPSGIQLLPSLPSSPSSLYPTNHSHWWTRAKSEPSKHLSFLNVRQRLIPIWMGASLRRSTPPFSSRTSRPPTLIR